MNAAPIYIPQEDKDHKHFNFFDQYFKSPHHILVMKKEKDLNFVLLDKTESSELLDLIDKHVEKDEDIEVGIYDYVLGWLALSHESLRKITGEKFKTLPKKIETPEKAASIVQSARRNYLARKKFKELLIKAKFYSGIANSYDENEKDLLKTWFISTKDTKDVSYDNIKEIYEEQIIRYKHETKANRYPDSVLEFVLKDLSLSDD